MAHKGLSSLIDNLSSLNEVQIYTESIEYIASLSVQFILEYWATHLKTEQSLILLPSPLN